MADYAEFIGKTKTVADVLLPARVNHLTATLRGLETGSSANPLFHGSHSQAGWPHGWHWCFFNEAREAEALGRDGHEKLGDFIPDLPLKRRMWAAGKLAFLADPAPGEPAEKQTTIASIEEKQGSTGPLIFVTLQHEVRQSGLTLLREEQTLVYREEITVNERPAKPTPKQQPAPRIVGARHDIRPDPVMLFRYSALTLNGHRIHYDADYARDVEGYRGIVFHAPLTATLLMGLAVKAAPARLTQFSFRAKNAIEGFASFTIALTDARNDGTSLAAILSDGRIAMQAEALWEAA